MVRIRNIIMQKHIKIIGHRGARGYAPENTLPSYKVALEQGVDAIDIDVALTADKIWVAYHNIIINPNITCSNDGIYLSNDYQEMIDNIQHYDISALLIKNMSWQHIQSNYRIQLNQQSAYAKFFPQQQSIANLRLSSLQDIINFVNQITNKSIDIQIEIKTLLTEPSWCY